MKKFSEFVTEAKKPSGQTQQLPGDALPAHVKGVVKKVHAVLKKHGIQGAKVSAQHHDYAPRHDKADGGHHSVTVELGHHHIDNEKAVHALNGSSKRRKGAGFFDPQRKGDVKVEPCASEHGGPAKHYLREEVEFVAEGLAKSPIAGMSDAEYRRQEGTSFMRKPKKLAVGSKVHVNGKGGVVYDIYSKKTSVGNKKFMHVKHDGGGEEHYRIDTTNHTIKD